jgi:hypothetical protein
MEHLAASPPAPASAPAASVAAELVLEGGTCAAMDAGGRCTEGICRCACLAHTLCTVQVAYLGQRQKNLKKNGVAEFNFRLENLSFAMAHDLV